jgi:uncharacterized membrane protein YcfT
VPDTTPPRPEGAAAAAAGAAPPHAADRRRLDLDRAKGLVILLVVFGHIVSRSAPPGVEWYEPVRYAIYRFHMPFFLYLSGTVLVFSGALATPPAGWAGLARRRAWRLLVPFFGLGLLILGAKYALAPLVHVDNPPAGLAGGLRDLFWTTAASPAVTVWYLAVLFLATLLALPLLRLGLGAGGLVGLGVVLWAVGLPPVAYLDRLASHFVFFAAGVWVAQRQDALLPLMERRWWLWWGLFAAALALALAGALDGHAALLACGLLSIPALHGMVRLPPVARWCWPLFFGRYAMAIYLFNTLAIGGTKALLILAGIGWTAEEFWVHAAALTLAGVALPVLLKRLVLRRVPVLDRLTD